MENKKKKSLGITEKDYEAIQILEAQREAQEYLEELLDGSEDCSDICVLDD